MSLQQFDKNNDGISLWIACPKCSLTDERHDILWCGPDQRVGLPLNAWYVMSEPHPILSAKPFTPYGAKEDSFVECKLSDEHFHLRCARCRYHWTDQID